MHPHDEKPDGGRANWSEWNVCAYCRQFTTQTDFRAGARYCGNCGRPWLSVAEQKRQKGINNASK